MPRDASGNYTLPLGNPVADGTIIDVNWANPTMSDIAVQLNNVITRDGVLGFTDVLKIIDGSLASPGLQFVSETSTGLHRPVAQSIAVVVNGTEIGRFVPTGVNVTGNMGASGNVSANGNLTVLGTTSLTGNVTVTGNITNPLGTILGVPIGTVIDYAGPFLPVGYVQCDGSALSRTTFNALFIAIGTTWGAGDGTTTFNVPFLQRYTTIGSGGTPSGTGVPANTLGSRGGNEGIILSIPQMPTHSHAVTDPGHTHGLSDPGHAHGISDPTHSHTTPFGSAGASPPGGAAIANQSYGGGISNYATTFQSTGIGIQVAGTGNLVNPASANVGTQTAGGNGVTSLMQPSAVVHKIIRAF